MANKADVIVRNVFFDSVQVVRTVPDGTNDLDVSLDMGVQEKIILPDTETALSILAPDGLDVKEAPIKVKSDVDLNVSHSRTNSSWTFKIEPNDLPPDTPTSVNITLGDTEPE